MKRNEVNRIQRAKLGMKRSVVEGEMILIPVVYIDVDYDSDQPPTQLKTLDRTEVSDNNAAYIKAESFGHNPVSPCNKQGIYIYLILKGTKYYHRDIAAKEIRYRIMCSKLSVDRALDRKMLPALLSNKLVDLLVVLASVDETMNYVVRGAKIAKWNWTSIGDCSVQSNSRMGPRLPY